MKHDLEPLIGLFDNKIVKILTVLINNEGIDFYLRELASKSGVSPASTYRILNKLVNLKIVDKTEIKQLKIYRLSTNESTALLKKILFNKKDPLEEFIEQVSKIKEVKKVIMHAKPQKNNAFVMIIGVDIPMFTVNDIDLFIEKEHGFKIKILPLSPDQYLMLDSTHNGYKKVLYEKN